MSADATAPAMVQPVTRALAELQTSVVSAGVRAFDGWLERFIIYTLVARLSGLSGAPATPISANAIATSLGRPYESVRRHVNALVDQGLCIRTPMRILATREAVAQPHIEALTRVTHDSFVRFVAHLAPAEAMPVPRRDIGYDFAAGVRVAADVMLAVVDTNRDTHAGWVDLVLFSTVVAANCRDAGPFAGRPVPASRPVAATAVTRCIGLGQATVHRHCAAMVRSGQLRRAPDGYLVNRDWLARPGAQAVTQRSLTNVRRLLRTLALHGFPFDDPASAYLDGCPALAEIR